MSARLVLLGAVESETPILQRALGAPAVFSSPTTAMAAVTGHDRSAGRLDRCFCIRPATNNAPTRTKNMPELLEEDQPQR